MNMCEMVAKRIVQICAERDISTDRLSDISSVPRSEINDILGGESRGLDISTIKKLCDGLNITLSEFFSVPELGLPKKGA